MDGKIYEKIDYHKDDVTAFPCAIKGEALNCFGDPRFGRTKLCPFECQSSLSSLCTVLYIAEQEGESSARAGSPCALTKGSSFCVCACLLSSELLPWLRLVVLTDCSTTNRILTLCSFLIFSILFCSIRFCVCLGPSDVRIFRGRVKVETIGWLHFPFSSSMFDSLVQDPCGPAHFYTYTSKSTTMQTYTNVQIDLPNWTYAKIFVTYNRGISLVIWLTNSICPSNWVWFVEIMLNVFFGFLKTSIDK